MPIVRKTTERRSKEMKNTMSKLAIAVLAAAMALPLAAQVPTTYVANVPFEFTVDHTTMPAGQYEIQTSAQAPILLRSADANCYFNSSPLNWTAEKPELVFNRYGDRYFLSVVTTGYFSREAPTSKAESELKKADAGAGRRGNTQVFLALR